MLYCIDILKTIACLLIANFHSDILFPDSLSLLAFGGDIGNNIFFVVSGFVLVEGIKKTKWSDFRSWLKKRYWRILPLVIIAEVLYVIVRGELFSIKEIGRLFIFPTLYWFTGAIILFYPLLFLVQKSNSKLPRCGICLALIASHFFIKPKYAERYVIGFLAMLSGSEIKMYLNSNETKLKKIPKIILFFP